MTKFLQPSDQVHVTGRYGKGVRYRVRPVVATEVELTPAQRAALESYQAQPLAEEVGRVLQGWRIP